MTGHESTGREGLPEPHLAGLDSHLISTSFLSPRMYRTLLTTKSPVSSGSCDSLQLCDFQVDALVTAKSPVRSAPNDFQVDALVTTKSPGRSGSCDPLQL